MTPPREPRGPAEGSPPPATAPPVPPSSIAGLEGGESAGASPRELRFGEQGVSLRAKAARGTIINGTFVVALSVLTMLKGFVVAALLGAAEYGLWGFLAAVLGSLGWLKQVGIVDKFVQQDEADQQLAFQKAFTLEAIVSGAFLIIFLSVIPVLAVFYGLEEIVAPGLVLAAAIPAAVLQTPLWVFLRRMQFLKQRLLQSISPIVSFIVTVSLAVAGYGYWSLVLGLVAGAWATALASLIASPYPLRFRFDRATARQYLTFSWPMFVAGLSIIAMAQVPVLVATKALGLAAVGAIALSSLIPAYARQASDVVTQTMYPGVCAVKDRADLLFEVFTKSNRLGILWGAPLGVGMALFAPDLVEFVLGSQWEFAVGLLQAMGLVTAANQFGFNWTAFYRAIGRTKPIAAASLIQAGAICGIAVPLLLIGDLNGFAIGMGIATVIYLIVRAYYLSQLFPGFSLLRHALPAHAPAVTGAVAVLAGRVILTGDRGPEIVIAEVLLYVVTVVAATMLTEGALVREAIDYLRRRQARPRTA